MTGEYRVDLYTDAHDEFPARTRIRQTVAEAMEKAIELSEEDLATEEGCTCVDTAGDDEIAEVFPEHGHGTVVISEYMTP